MIRIAVLILLSMSAVAHAACEAPEHRQFDFWLGQWEVVGGPGTPAEGQVMGHNLIESSSGGCSLTENWSSEQGAPGRSLNVYDAAVKKWRQFWVGGGGVVLQLAGGWHDGIMDLRGEQPGKDGAVQLQRITWTPNADGSVLQRWDTSDDAGANWNLAFLGLYRRSTSP